MRAIIRCRDDHYLHPVPPLDLTGCRALHLDGHQADAAIHYAKLCRETGILTSLDGGGMRSNTMELLEFIDVAICSERLCEQLKLTPAGALRAAARAKAAGSAASPWARKGLVWYDESGKIRHMPALAVPKDEVIDTNGAGDIFHGAYVYSYLAKPREAVGRAFPLRARRLRAFGALSRHRALAADPGRRRGRRAGIPRGGVMSRALHCPLR